MAAKILIIEDEPLIVENIRYALETDGFVCEHFLTGGEGEEALRNDGADLVVLDVGLPDANGFELCKVIREFSEVPILFLTARSEEIDRVVGLEIGGDDYMTKPFSPRELVARVKAILKRVQRVSVRRDGDVILEDVIRGEAGGVFYLDEARQRVGYFGKDLELSRYEFRLLAFLIKHPGRVFTREQLMNEAWEEPEASLDRTVDAHVKKIRAKLREVRAEADPIQTHRGVGYSLKEMI